MELVSFGRPTSIVSPSRLSHQEIQKAAKKK